MDEAASESHHGREHLMTALALIAEYVAAQYGISWLALFGSFFLFLAFRGYSRRYLETKSKHLKYASYFGAIVILLVVTLVVIGVRMPPAHRHAVTSPSPPKTVPEARKEPPTNTPPPTSNGRPSVPRETGHHPKDGSQQKPRNASRQSRGNNSPNVGPITQGPGSIAQVGGSGNQATVNNFGSPPPPPLQWTISVKDVVPPVRSEFKYQKEITVTPNVSWSPVSIAINCDAEIDLVDFNTRLGGAFTHVSAGLTKEDHKVGYVYFDSPAITPEVPLLIQVYSSNQFSVLSINRAKIGDLPN